MPCSILSSPGFISFDCNRFYMESFKQKEAAQGQPLTLLRLPASLRGNLWSQFCSTFGINTDELTPAALVFEFYEAFDQGEQRIVLAAADVVTGFPFCPALTRQNIAAEDLLAAEFFESEPLCIRIAAVSG
jgi:hypothetical protein